MFAAYLSHSDWSVPEFFISHVSVVDAEAKAIARLMEHTADYRDHDDYEADESWIDLCLSENWTLEAGEVMAPPPASEEDRKEVFDEIYDVVMDSTAKDTAHWIMDLMGDEDITKMAAETRAMQDEMEAEDTE